MKNKGITIIALTIIIVVLLILAGVGISMLTGENGILTKAEESKFKAMASGYLEQFELYKVNYKIDEYMGKPLDDMLIKEVIPDIKKEYQDRFYVYDKKLYFSYDKEIKKEVREAKWAEEVGVNIFRGNIKDSVMTLNGTDTYAYSPELRNLNEFITYYVTGYDENGKAITKPCTEEITKTWYDYSEGVNQWANIIINTNGLENHLVWIPRYVYYANDDTVVTNTSGNIKVDFCDIDDKIYDENGNITEPKEGYKVPEAFNIDSDGDGTIDIKLKGFWVGKFEVSNPYALGSVRIVRTTDTQIVMDKPYFTGVARFKIFLDDVFVEENETCLYTFNNLDANKDYKVKIEIYYPDGDVNTIEEIVPAFKQANAPSIDELNKSKTWYITYDDNGNEIKTSMLEEQPANWYDYTAGQNKWANILVENEGQQNYLVWIPRYQYKVNQYSEICPVFVNDINDSIQGYNIPEAFNIDSDANGSVDIKLKGFWVGKYEASAETPFNSVSIERISDTEIKADKCRVPHATSYKFYLNGKLKETKDVCDYTFSNLNPNEDYTVKVVIYNREEEIYIVEVLRPSFKSVNEPDISGFVGENLKLQYLTYDNNGNEVLNDTKPADWYDYSVGQNKWANIVVSNKTTGEKNYLVWIPRYQYRIDEYEKIHTVFVSGTNDNAQGYKIPDAFNIDSDANGSVDIKLKGFWVGKYEASLLIEEEQ